MAYVCRQQDGRRGEILFAGRQVVPADSLGSVNTEQEQLRALATRLASEAGRLLISMEPGKVTAKTSPTDPATEADWASEQLIFGKLREARPQDSIISEEGAVNEGTSGIEWVVDPLDGTVNYVYGIPQWCVSIGVEGAVRFGVIYDPSHDEMFSDPGLLRPSGVTEPEKALVATGFGYSADVRAQQAEVVRQILPKVRDIRRAGSAALDLAWVACGRLDGYYERGVHRWDTSAGLALVEAAGGATLVEGDITMAAGTAELLRKLRDLVLDVTP